MKSKRLSVLCSIVLAGGIAAGLSGCKDKPKTETQPSDQAVSTAGTLSTGAVLATINGRDVYEAEIIPMVQGGMDRASALDRRITQSVLANAAEKDFGKEAKALMEANRADILAQLYMRKRLDALKTEITDKDVEDYYNKNVLDEDYKQYKLKALITNDAREAQTAFEALEKGRESKDAAAAAARMQPITRGTEQYLNVQDIPYNLGQVIKKMKVGEVMRPVVIREGVLVVLVEDVKENPKPTLEKAKEEIRSVLVSERIGKEVQDLRKAAKIELKG